MKLKTRKTKLARISFYLSVMAGILYNSWPLGYIFDKSTARYGLASDLEKVGHPYYWVFIGGDVLTGLVILTICLIYRHEFSKYFKSRSFKLLIFGLSMFAVFTIIAALLPSECSITPILRYHSIAGQGLGIDALTSTIAAVGLFLSLISLIRLNQISNLNSITNRLTIFFCAAWLITSFYFIYIAIRKFSTHNPELILITLTGFVIALIGLNVYEIIKMKKLD